MAVVRCVELGTVSLVYWALEPRTINVPGSVGFDWGELHVGSVGVTYSHANEAESRTPDRIGAEDAHC